MDRLQHALRLASLGFLISPLRPGTKLPYAGESWQEMQTDNPAVIAQWFLDRANMNYAVCPGAHGVIIDPDVDESKGKNGLALFEEIEAENFEDTLVLGNTFTVRTPRGGRHLYLTTPHAVGSRDGGFPDGIDVRGAGGYVVGPGSVTVENKSKNTAAGTYEIEDALPVLAAPAWIMSRLDVARDRDSNAAEAIGEEDTEAAIERIRGLIRSQTSWPTEGHGGDHATYQFIAMARNYGAVTPEKMFELLSEPYEIDGDFEPLSWNERCVPPWSGTDLNKKIENAYSYSTSAAGSKGGLLESLDMEGSQYLGEHPDLTAEKEKVLSKLDGMYFPGDTLAKRAVRREYVIDQWMLAHGMTQLIAFRSTGKSILMFDLSMKIACDMDWFNNSVSEGWAVVYCVGEDDEGIQAQMDAWIGEHKVKPKEDRLIVMTGVPDLTSLTECEEWVRFLKAKLNGRRCVLAIDTWQRATAKASQNDDQQMNAATDMIDHMATLLGGPSLIAFHPPKGNMETISGSMVIENKGSAIWKMNADAVVKKVVVDRIKGKGRGNFIKMFFNEVNLPYKDQWGKFETAIVTQFAGNNEGDSAALKNSNSMARGYWAQIVWDVMDLAEHEGSPKFDQKDIAARIVAWKETHATDESVRRLFALGESISGSERYVGERLKSIFIADGPAVPCHDGYGCVYVAQGSGKSHGKKYIRCSFEDYKADHPDKYPEPIPMVPGDEDAADGKIAY